MKHSDEHIQQQIESYLNQEMTDLERSRFEKQIHDNPELHEEVQLQEATMEAIRRERMLILKSGLSQVPISMWSTGLLEVAKVAAISVGIGLAAVGGYYAFDNYEHGKPQPEAVHSQSTSEIGSNELKHEDVSPNLETTRAFDSTPENAEVPADKSVVKDKLANSEKREKTSSKGEKSSVSSESQDDFSLEPPVEPSPKAVQALSSKDVANPVDGISNKTSLESIHPEVVFKKDNKNIFHYQFSDGKLILYADFTDKLYEVIELNQNGTKQVFFCYENTFYPLNSNQFDIAPLKAVQDKNLIQILRAYQKRRN